MQDIIQNLKDSGCDGETIKKIYGLYSSGYVEDAIIALRSFRNGLMDELHESQSKVDCLDYLVYRLRKESKNAANI